MNRGVIYIVWGKSIQPLLERSMASVKRYHPELPIEVMCGDPDKGLFNKPNMYDFSPFEETLFLDADTVVMGNLDFAFRQAVLHGVACCIGECPWLRRYGPENKDLTEYNTGVIFFCKARENRPDHAYRDVKIFFEEWKALAPKSPGSRWRQGDEIVGLEKDDQWSFSRAMATSLLNPCVLPLNWNFRPGFHTRFFTPLKIWHSVHDVPPGLEDLGMKVERGEDLVQFCTLANRD